MMPRWASLDEQGRATYRALVAFLDGRLEERATVEWALRLKSNETIKRLALLDLIDSVHRRNITEPWRSAWRLIEESWSSSAVERQNLGTEHQIDSRLRAGERSGSLINAVVALVAPRLKVEPFSNLDRQFRKPAKRPKRVEDLFSTGVTSGEVINPETFKLGKLADGEFLFNLALALDAAVDRGLDIARRIGWPGESRLWELGGLHRVYYVPSNERPGEHEPDEFHRGIAPAVKLLYAVVSRLVDIDLSGAIEFATRWKLRRSPIHLRLWAALSRSAAVTPADEVASVLLSLDDRRFWSVHDYPEVAEVRATRFKDFSFPQQEAIGARTRKGAPRRLWARSADPTRIASWQRLSAIRELKRIETLSGVLLAPDKAWLDANIGDYPQLIQMRADEGFLTSPEARFVPPNPDDRFDSLAGVDRLKALEVALSSERRGWQDSPAERASDWIRQKASAHQVLTDFESVPDGGASFPRVWERFGWVHSPQANENESSEQQQMESVRVLSQLDKLPSETIRQAIEGISHWLSTWQAQVVLRPEGLGVWLKVWPIAVDVTNSMPPDEEGDTLNTVAPSTNDSEPADLDTLNTPVGKLVGVFLTACPTVKPGDKPFLHKGVHSQMRDAMEASIGAAGLIVKYRLIEPLHYFLKADPEWTEAHLVQPLLQESEDARILWRAVAHRTRFVNELKVIGEAMVYRAMDEGLGRAMRRSLIFSLVLECLYALYEQREPAVPYTQVTQAIRSIEDELRAHAAEVIQRFVRDVSAAVDTPRRSPSPEQLFRSAAAPFLKEVWPQERALATPGVSRALAELPATARGAFAEAVDVVERFLVPFECWSMIEYGLYGEENGEPKLSIIDDPLKAGAFLRLLDLTIGTAEGAVVPQDLPDALERIRKMAPNLAGTREFRRLATAARRP